MQADREYFNPHHLLLVLQPGTSEHSWSFLTIVKKEQELRFQPAEELSGGLAEVVWDLMSDIKRLCALWGLSIICPPIKDHLNLPCANPGSSPAKF